MQRATIRVCLEIDSPWFSVKSILEHPMVSLHMSQPQVNSELHDKEPGGFFGF